MEWTTRALGDRQGDLYCVANDLAHRFGRILHHKRRIAHLAVDVSVDVDIEALETSSLRKALGPWRSNLHLTFEKPPKPLGSRNLLQRLTLVGRLIENLTLTWLGCLYWPSKLRAKLINEEDPELQIDLEMAYRLNVMS